jgi:hypothetical protein
MFTVRVSVVMAFSTEYPHRTIRETVGVGQPGEPHLIHRVAPSRRNFDALPETAQRDFSDGSDSG